VRKTAVIKFSLWYSITGW